MVEAVALVRAAESIDMGDGMRSIETVCAHRLVAALYTALHYHAEEPCGPEPALLGRGRGVFVVKVPWP